MDRKLVQEINRLFDELVHHPWSRGGASPRPRSAPASFLIEIPLGQTELDGIVVTSEGQRVTLSVSARPRAGATAAPGERQEYHQTFEVPEGTRPAGFEAHSDGTTLRVRVLLAAREGA